MNKINAGRLVDDLKQFFKINVFEFNGNNTNIEFYNEEVSKESEELVKLRLIEQSLNQIDFKGLNEFEDIEHKSQGYYDFILKLNFFNMMKKFVKGQRNKKIIKSKLSQKENISKLFNNNLLKSRAFYGLLKWIKNINYYEIIKKNYYEYKKINLSNFMVKILIYVYNRKNLINAFSELRFLKIKKKLINSFTNKIKFRICQKKNIL